LRTKLEEQLILECSSTAFFAKWRILATNKKTKSEPRPVNVKRNPMKATKNALLQLSDLQNKRKSERKKRRNTVGGRANKNSCVSGWERIKNGHIIDQSSRRPLGNRYDVKTGNPARKRDYQKTHREEPRIKKKPAVPSARGGRRRRPCCKVRRASLQGRVSLRNKKKRGGRRLRGTMQLTQTERTPRGALMPTKGGQTVSKVWSTSP